MKIRKNHARKRYRYNINRKTLRRTQTSTGKIKDPILKQHYEDRKRPSKNFYDMGLVTDLNKFMPIPNYKQERIANARIVNGFVEEELDEEEPQNEKKSKIRRKAFVTEELEEKIKNAKGWDLKLPKSVVNNLIYFLNKYNFDYKAMANDKRNYDQWTWKHFRMKIKKFMSIPEQFNAYLKERKLPLNQKPDWPEYESDSEWR